MWRYSPSLHFSCQVACVYSFSFYWCQHALYINNSLIARMHDETPVKGSATWTFSHCIFNLKTSPPILDCMCGVRGSEACVSIIYSILLCHVATVNLYGRLFSLDFVVCQVLSYYDRAAARYACIASVYVMYSRGELVVKVPISLLARCSGPTVMYSSESGAYQATTSAFDLPINAWCMHSLRRRRRLTGRRLVWCW